ncbi:MAG: hypothetical protein ABR927_11825 [Bacteroidales bacterium]|jgi:hypothetical protein
MSEITTPNKNVRDDEIDLLDLFRRMGNTLNRWTNALGKAFLTSVVFLIRRWLPLGLSVIAGIGISYLLKTTSSSFFTSDVVFRNNLALMDMKKMRDNSGTTSEIISKINKLHTFCAENNTAALSQALSMKPESVRNISDMGAYWIIDQSRDGIPDFVDYKGNHSAYDTVDIRMQDRLDVRVKINSPQDLNLVRDGIVKFIENDSLYQQRNRVRLRQNQELLARLGYDIKQLDSLQKVKYFEETRNVKPASGGQIVFMQEQKTQLVYSDIYSLYSRKQQIETDRDLYKGVVTILSDFSLPAKRDNGGMYYGKYVIPILFFLTLLILIIIANRGNLEEIYKKY